MKKMLLIHGWNYTNYSSTKCTDAWANRKAFVSLLEQHFLVVKINLPGFCGTPDPESPWTIDDYVRYISLIIEKEKPDYILGYSFGGALALDWKYVSMDKKVKVFLVSPAIVRRYDEKTPTTLQQVLKLVLPKKAVDWMRYVYLSVIKKNPYYTKATPIMRETYRSIVTVDLRTELAGLDEPVVLIYGEKDTATPPDLVRQAIEDRHVVEIIAGGGHDIANTHTSELISLILKNGGVIEN